MTQAYQRDFNSQPREGGWKTGCHDKGVCAISTHSRAKAAGTLDDKGEFVECISTHSRAKAAGSTSMPIESGISISTHSRAKAAGSTQPIPQAICEHFNSQPREGGWPIHDHRVMLFTRFQLTAARRRLVTSAVQALAVLVNFNSQPREGGWEYTRY